MATPGFESYMKPILILMNDDKIRKNKEVRNSMIISLKLSQQDLEERQEGTGHLKYKDNINFALSYLSLAGLLRKVSRGEYQITNDGKEIVNTNPETINTKYLKTINKDFKDRMESHYQNSDSQKSENNENILKTTQNLNPVEQIVESENILNKL